MHTLPKFITANSSGRVLSTFNALLHCSDDILNLDAADTVYVEPLGLCFMAAFCDKAHLQGKEVKIHNLQDHLVSYLSRMDVLMHCKHDYLEHSEVSRNDQRESLVEVHCLNDREQVAGVANMVSTAVVGNTPDFSPDALPDEMTGHKPHEKLESNLAYMFNELLENSLTHARHHGYDSSKVWVASQYYPKKDVIRMGIVDTGCGFLESLRGHEQRPASDVEAIKLAMEPRVSCNRDVGLRSDSVNEGVGLTVVCRMILESQGGVSLFSGGGFVKCALNKTFDSFSETSHWSGTAIGFEVNRSNLKDREIREIMEKLRSETGLSDTNVDIHFV